MKHQQQQQQRVFVARKHCARFQVEWSDEDDALLAGRRCITDPVTTTANKHHVRMLQEIFPTTDCDVLMDVLIAAQFQVDVAAAMLGDLVCAPTSAAVDRQQQHQHNDTPTSDAPSIDVDFEMTSIDDDDDWSQVSAVAPSSATEPQSWIMVHDEWEVVGLDGESVETFADKLRRAGANAPTTAATSLPLLSIVSAKPTRPTQRTTAKFTEPLDSSGSERSVKSFGARKRRFRKTRA